MKSKVKKIPYHHLNTPPSNSCATKEQSAIVLKIFRRYSKDFETFSSRRIIAKAA